MRVQFDGGDGAIIEGTLTDYAEDTGAVKVQSDDGQEWDIEDPSILEPVEGAEEVGLDANAQQLIQIAANMGIEDLDTSGGAEGIAQQLKDGYEIPVDQLTKEEASFLQEMGVIEKPKPKVAAKKPAVTAKPSAKPAAKKPGPVSRKK
jgi:hypothetical protein